MVCDFDDGMVIEPESFDGLTIHFMGESTPFGR
jgi:hypothetical protein